MKKKPTPVLHLARVPADIDAQLAVVLNMHRALTGREPTPEEVEEARKELAG
jgi:hypothetical protein